MECSRANSFTDSQPCPLEEIYEHLYRLRTELQPELLDAYLELYKEDDLAMNKRISWDPNLVTECREFPLVTEEFIARGRRKLVTDQLGEYGLIPTSAQKKKKQTVPQDIIEITPGCDAIQINIHHMSDCDDLYDLYD